MAYESTGSPLSSRGSTGELWQSLVAAQEEVEELQTQVNSLAGKVAEQNKTITDLKAENDRLRSALGSYDDPDQGQKADLQHSSVSPAVVDRDNA